MKVMLDTNILISAALFPNGQAAKAFSKALTPPFEPVICEYIIDEVHRKFRQKFPARTTELEAFLFNALSCISLVPVPEAETEAENHIRDIKDRPILRAAVAGDIDLLLTGDKDFLESDIHSPKMVSVAEFLEKYS